MKIGALDSWEFAEPGASCGGWARRAGAGKHDRDRRQTLLLKRRLTRRIPEMRFAPLLPSLAKILLATAL